VYDLKQVLIRRGSPAVVDVPAPQLTDHTILVEVRFSLISTGTEIAGLVSANKSVLRQAIEDPRKVIRGLQMMKDVGFHRTMSVVDGELETAFPAGYSCSGEVLACGKNVSGFAVGDRVACGGAGLANHAEIVAIPQNLAVRVPEGCDLESAASATIGAIALQGVRRADVRLGENVAVIGLGLIGQLTVQLLRAAGCKTIGIDIDSERVANARAFGLNAGFNSADGLSSRQVLNYTEGRGADAVIITASSQTASVIQQAMQIVRRKGRVVVVGSVPLQMDRSPFYEKEADLLMSCSYGPGRYDPEYEERGLDYPYAYVRWTENRNMAEYLRLVAEGQVSVSGVIGKTWSVLEAPEAYRDLRENKHAAVLLSYPEGSSHQKVSSTVRMPTLSSAAGGRIRVGIIRAGNFARAVHIPNLQLLKDSFSIGAVASRTGPAAWNVAKQCGAKYATTEAEAVLKDTDIDLVVIATRHNLHAPLAMDALRHGKAVFLEKPAALTEEELRQLLEAARTSGSPLMVGHNRRFSPFMEQARSILADRSGPAMLTYRMNAGYISPDSWVHGPEGGGRIIGECCHIFDLFNFLIGRFPQEVMAASLRPASPDIVAADNFSTTQRYEDGSLCTLTYTSLGSTDVPKESMEIFFDGKTLVLDDYRKLTSYGLGKKPATSTKQEKGHLEEFRALARYMQGTGPLPMTLDEIEAATKTSFIVDALVRTS
jgi:predicted dehydrogenase